MGPAKANAGARGGGATGKGGVASVRPLFLRMHTESCAGAVSSLCASVSALTRTWHMRHTPWLAWSVVPSAPPSGTAV